MLGHLCTWLGLTSQVLGYYLWYYAFGYKAIFYARVLQLLRNKNILFTKIFQSLANSQSVTSEPELRDALAPYTATVSYTEDEIQSEEIDAVEAAYDVRINRHPLNSGMIALIFRGVRISDGTPVILKLKRRDIDTQLRTGCESVTFLYSYASYWFPRNLYVRVLRPFIQNIDDIIEQCDFHHEIQNMREAVTDFAELPFVQIPTVYNLDTQLTNTSYILMENIEGVHVLPPDTSEEVRLEYLRKFCLFTTFGFLSNAMQHTDLHAGNVLYTERGLGIIDYGMALRPSDEIHDIVLTAAEIVRDPALLDQTDCLEEIRNLFVPPLAADTIRDVPLVRTIILSMVRPLRDNITLDELNITDQLNRLSVELGHEIVLHRDFYKIILGLSMMGCLVPIMGPTYQPEQIRAIEREALERAFIMII